MAIRTNEQINKSRKPKLGNKYLGKDNTNKEIYFDRKKVAPEKGFPMGWVDKKGWEATYTDHKYPKYGQLTWDELLEENKNHLNIRDKRKSKKTLENSVREVH